MHRNFKLGTIPVKGGYGNSVMVWKLFTWYELNPMVKLNQSLTGKRYIQLFDDCLQTFMHSLYVNDDGRFRDNNALSHRVHIVSDFYEKHFGKFQHIVWSFRFPDVNPMEHILKVI